MFWKQAKLERKGEQAREEMVKDVYGEILRDGKINGKIKRFRGLNKDVLKRGKASEER